MKSLLAHEFTHCRRRDLLVKQLAWLAERYYCHLNLVPARNGALIMDCSINHIYNSHYTAAEAGQWIAQIHE